MTLVSSAGRATAVVAISSSAAAIVPRVALAVATRLRRGRGRRGSSWSATLISAPATSGGEGSAVRTGLLRRTLPHCEGGHELGFNGQAGRERDALLVGCKNSRTVSALLGDETTARVLVKVERAQRASPSTRPICEPDTSHSPSFHRICPFSERIFFFSSPLPPVSVK